MRAMLMMAALALGACGEGGGGDGAGGAGGAPACVDEPGRAPCCDQTPLTADDCPAGTTFAEGEQADGDWGQGCVGEAGGAVVGVEISRGAVQYRMTPDRYTFCSTATGLVIGIMERTPTLCVAACWDAVGEPVTREECDATAVSPTQPACQE